MASNILFLYSLLDTISHGWALASFIILAYILLMTVPVLKRSWILIAYVSLIILSFIFLKKYFILEKFSSFYPTYTVIGLSYILFRTIQLIVDRSQGMLPERPSPLSYLAYIIFFPALLSGPIHRLDDFDAGIQANSKKSTYPYARLLMGLIKVVILSPILEQLFLSASSNIYPDQSTMAAVPWDFLTTLQLPILVGISASVYTVYLYFNFSGYTDIAISTASFFNIELPENFNSPFQARNIAEFWSRWHISLSVWVKTYIFNPLLSHSISKFPNRLNANAISLAVLFAAFFIIGVWHGSTLAYIYFGTYLGVTAVAHRAYQIAMLSWLGRKSLKSLNEHKVYSSLCRGLTFSYFAAALMCFAMNAEQLAVLLVRLGALTGIIVFLGLSAVASLALLAIDGTIVKLKLITLQFTKILPVGWYEQIEIAVLTLTILVFGTMSETAPSFVYQAY